MSARVSSVPTKLGQEFAFVCEGGQSKSCAKHRKRAALEHVEAVTLDDFMRLVGLRSVYHVHVDTEGWDALVI